MNVEGKFTIGAVAEVPEKVPLLNFYLLFSVVRGFIYHLNIIAIWYLHPLLIAVVCIPNWERRENGG